MNSASELLIRANQHLQAGELAAAEPLYRAVLAVDPHNAQAHNDLGVLLQQRSQFDEAAVHFQVVLQSLPDCAEAYVNLGTNFHARGRLDDAAAAYRAALALAPAAETHHALGRVLLQQGQLDHALTSCQEALRLDRQFAAAYVTAARALRLQGRLDDAVDFLTQARPLEPRNTDTLCDLGARLKDLGRVDEAIGVFREAVAVNPAFPGFHGNLLYSLNVRGGDSTAIFAEHRAFGQTVCDPLTALSPPHDVDRTASRRLRIGYVSAQFWAHAVNAFSEPILAAHDRSKFEVFCYDNGSPADGTNQRLRGLVDHWRPISQLDDEQAAALVRSDRIDILVDLCGHIAGNRLLLFARKPAPVQVTYLGYQNTTGMQAMDYRLTDDWADPPGTSEALYTEELLRLPRSFFCYQPWPEAPPVGALPALANGFVTFGSFNDFAKCTPAALPVWAKLLRTVRDSRLTVLGPAVPSVRQRIAGVLAEEGISAERFKLVDRAPRREYLARLSQVDIALDPFPLNGHTTTCDALWQGVPVVTFGGRMYAERFGSSAHRTLGLHELVATTPAEYVAIAAKLASHLARLGELRDTLRARMTDSPLLDYAGFVRELERTYQTMWDRWCADTRVAHV